MLRLYQHSERWGLSSFDPFCITVRTYAKLAGAEECLEVINQDNPSLSATQRLPIMEHEGRFIPQEQILSYFENQLEFGLDSHLSEEQKAASFAFKSLIESKLYYFMLHFWYQDDNYSQITRNIYTATLPFPVSQIQMFLYQKSMIEQLESLHIEGDENVARQAGEIYDCLSSLLGSKTYFYGSKPCSLDAVAFGHFSSQMFAPMPKRSLREEILKFDNLVAYVERNAKNIFGFVPCVEKEKKRLAEKREASRKFWRNTLFAIGGIGLIYIIGTNFNSEPEQ